jgi:membrane glycosyltransferase
VNANKKGLVDHRNWRKVMRRSIYFLLILFTTFFAMSLLSAAYLTNGGITPLKLLLLLLYAILMMWIATSFWSAALGFWVLLTRCDYFAKKRNSRIDSTAAISTTSRTAILMPIYSEDVSRVYAAIRAMWQSLQETENADIFDLFILSDTQDAEAWCKEEYEWFRLNNELGTNGRIFYRNRIKNLSHKSGNIGDFVQNWGGNYLYMIILDADSIISGITMCKLVKMMESQPRTALIQAPPIPINKETLFARIIQFASTAFGPIFFAGASYWQLGESNFWGHNAIIRIAPFAEHCGLPKLSGREPFGGDILSHDFVEGALLRRAGWNVWLAYELEGSFEEVPPTLIDYAKRDRRWCQGNMQHLRLIFARNFHPMCRIHFAMGAMSYLSSPLWFLFLLIAGVEAYMQMQESQVYFVPIISGQLVPIWPDTYKIEMQIVLMFTLAMLFLPKILALILIGINSTKRRLFGGIIRVTVSAVLESIFSILVAPVFMLFQTKFVLAILLRRNIGWPTQQRADCATSFLEAISAHGIQTVIAVLAGIATYLYVPNYFWWFLPVLVGVLMIVPISMLSSSVVLGRFARHLGLFLTPFEQQSIPIVESLKRELANSEQRVLTNLEALQNTTMYALHLGLLPKESLSEQIKNRTTGIFIKMIVDGKISLTSGELREIYLHANSFREFHLSAWAEVMQKSA